MSAAAAAAKPVAVLRRAVLLTGLLTVIAGFLGMHIIAGSRRANRQRSPGPAVVHLPGRMRRDTGAPPPAPNARPPIPAASARLHPTGVHRRIHEGHDLL